MFCHITIFLKLFSYSLPIFIQFIKQEKYIHLGVSPHDASDRLFHPIHCFQFADGAAVVTFADGAAVVTSDKRKNQLLLNCFTRWCQWAYMQVRVEKCLTFGIKKFSTRSLQFQPKLLVNSKSVSTIKNGQSFKYLGRFFNFEMNNKDHKDLFSSSLHDMLQTVDSLHIHSKNKLLLYHRYILSKLSWHLAVADLSKTWICELLDNIVTKYIRQWLELPISATLSAIILSPNCGTNIQYDTYKNTKHVLKIVHADHAEQFQSKLPSQGFIISFLLEGIQFLVV